MSAGKRPSNDQPAARRALREIDVLALLAMALCVVLGILSRDTLSPDGVSYLDLAHVLGRGDLTHFVQGYWSPFYPTLVALGALVTRTDGASLVRLAHGINVLIAIATIAILWRELRRTNHVVLGRMGVAALLLCSARPPRVDAVTPDLLMICVMLAITAELLFHRAARWGRLGLLLGLAFLVKTSTWPWLLATAVVRLLDAARRRAWRPVVLSTAVCVAVAAFWIVPLSLREGHLTAGSAGRLNYCWYIEECDSRTPDTHLGQHERYRTSMLSNGIQLTWASFAPDTWTYLPWSDPTAWARGVRSSSAHAPSVFAWVRYSAILAGYVGGAFLLALIASVLVPAYWLGSRAGMWRALPREHRESMIAMVLGLLGIAQFIAVHAEARLIAPFALMLALGALVWLLENPTEAQRRSRRSPRNTRPSPGGNVRAAASLIGLACVVPFAIISGREYAGMNRRIQLRTSAIEAWADRTVPGGLSQRRIVIVGPAVPFLMDAFRVGAQIVAQVLPASALQLQTLPLAERQRLAFQLFGGQADAVWFTKSDETFEIASLRAQ